MEDAAPSQPPKNEVPLPAPAPKWPPQFPPATADRMASAPPNDPPVLRPEPRQRPKNGSSLESFSKKMPESTGQPSASIPVTRAKSTYSARVIRILLPPAFVLLIVAAVFGILTILSNRSGNNPGFNKPQLPARLPEKPRIPAETPPSESAASISETSVNPPPELPAGIKAVEPAKEIYAVLEKFLAASSLQERLPLLETKTTATELAKSCLASPLPAASNISLAARDTNPIEQVTDSFYHVDFVAGVAVAYPATILVRKRAGSDPKVVADPFLDSFGGRLAAYASAPVAKAGLFQLIGYPLASCTDENVPNNEKKLTLRLLAREDGREIGRAYFGRQSRIGLMLEDGTRGLRFGSAHPCSVMLRWNSEDDPEHPYLEAIDLKSLDWNP